MGMTIDESLENLKTLQADYQQFYDDVWQDPESYGIIAESLQVAIDVVYKYQKIEEIWYKWRIDSSVRTNVAMSKIGEVLKDDRN